MEIRQLRYFLEAARQEHITQAARSLHITQSTLSHQLRQLENKLGTPLFDRVGRQVRLTEAGRLFSRFAAKALNDLEDGHLALQSLNNLQSGQLRIGVITTYTNALLAKVIASFTSRFPGIHLYIEDLPMSQIEDRLQNGQLDLGLAFTATETTGLSVEPLFSECLLLLVRNDHPLAGRQSVYARELASLDIALQAQQYTSRQLIDRHLAKHIKDRIRLELDSIQTMQSVVAQSHLACMLFESAVLQNPDLKAIPIIAPNVLRTAALLWPRDRFRSVAAKQFAHEIKISLPSTLANPTTPEP